MGALSVCLSVICVASHVYKYTYMYLYTCIHVVCMRALCACICWEYIFSLTTGWTWGHAAAAASPLLGCWIQHDVFSSNNILIIYNDQHFWTLVPCSCLGSSSLDNGAKLVPHVIYIVLLKVLSGTP